MKKITPIKTDLLIIGGGTAGCMAAVFARQKAPELDVTIIEKAHISRSGCLAMGLNAVNAYLVDSTPEEYLRYVLKDNYAVLRSDLVLSIGRRLNRMTHLLEEFGVPLPRGRGRALQRALCPLDRHARRASETDPCRSSAGARGQGFQPDSRLPAAEKQGQ